jgi:hypothetical protein
MRVFVLVRIDDPAQKVDLVRWQNHFGGWWAFSRQIIKNRRTPGLFPNSVWRVESPTPVEK